MAAASKKNRLLEQRRKDVEAELARVTKDLKAIARDGRKISLSSSPRLRPVPPPEGASVLRGSGSTAASIDDPDGVATYSAPTSATSAMPSSSPGRTPARDERFASYFITGSFHGIKPLRHEQRIIRNRAILIGIVILLMLFWVVRLLLDL